MTIFWVFLQHLFLAPGFYIFWFFANFSRILCIYFLSRVLRKYGDPINMIISFFNFDFLWRFLCGFNAPIFCPGVLYFLIFYDFFTNFVHLFFAPCFTKIWGSNKRAHISNKHDHLFFQFWFFVTIFVCFQCAYFLSRGSIFFDFLRIFHEFCASIFCLSFYVNMGIQ